MESRRASLSLGQAVFCEHRGTWANALRHELCRRGIALRETRSLVECGEVLTQCPGSLLFLEMTPANIDRVIERLATLERVDRAARAVVVAPRSLAAYGWLVHEAGGLALETSLRRATLLAALAERFFAERPVEELPLVEQVWARLPWKDVVGQRRGAGG